MGDAPVTWTILLVDDHDTVAYVSRLILEKSGYEVITATRPEEALRLCEEHPRPIHLLLTDVMMPQMPGPRLYEAACGHCPGLRVLFMSGYTEAEMDHHRIGIGGHPCIQKPFSAVGLIEKVREILG
jgi:two-component system cell cycle sensor histidine kinase/response regulator CckA